MRYSRRDNQFRVLRNTGHKENGLALTFSDSPIGPEDVIIAGLTRAGRDARIHPEQAQIIKKMVLEGVEKCNREMGTRYHIRTIEYRDFDYPDEWAVYAFLAGCIVTRLYHHPDDYSEINAP